MTTITKKQIAAIHILKNRHGVDDGDYRARLIRDFGVSSCTQLTRRQASDLMAALAGGKRKRNPRKARPRPKKENLPQSVTRLVSPEQRRLIDALKAEIKWRAQAGYMAWLKTNMRLVQVASDQEAARVIEGLKAIKRRQAKERPDG